MMKKTIGVLALILILCLASCKATGDSSPSVMTPTDSEALKTEESSISTSSQTADVSDDSSKPEQSSEIAPSPPEPESSTENASESAEPPVSSETSSSVTSSVPEAAPAPKPQAKMSLSGGGISGGILADEYGMRGNQQKDGVPTLSLPLSIKDAPENTVCYAVIMRDPDSKPLCGYEWTHWLAANISGAQIAANASIDNAANMTQGKNDFGTTGYGGPTPPDKPHTYKITVYALDTKLELKNGYSKDALVKAMDGHILAEATLSAKYSN